MDHWEKLEKRKALMANTREYIEKTCPHLSEEGKVAVIKKVYAKMKFVLELP